MDFFRGKGKKISLIPSSRDLPLGKKRIRLSTRGERGSSLSAFELYSYKGKGVYLKKEKGRQPLDLGRWESSRFRNREIFEGGKKHSIMPATAEIEEDSKGMFFYEERLPIEKKSNFTEAGGGGGYQGRMNLLESESLKRGGEWPLHEKGGYMQKESQTQAERGGLSRRGKT